MEPSPQPPPNLAPFKIAFAASLVAGALSLCVFGGGFLWLATLPEGAGSGMAGFAIIAQVLALVAGFAGLAFTCLAAAAFAALGLRPARTVDTVGPEDIVRQAV